MSQESHELNSVGKPVYHNITVALESPISDMPKSDHYIICDCVEVINGINHNDYRDKIQTIVGSLKPTFKELLIITDKTAEDLFVLQEVDSRIRVINLSFWAMYSFYAVQYRKQKTKTTPTKNLKFRFTPGKLGKSHRLLAVEALRDMGYLDEEKGDWSLRMPKPGTLYYQQIEEVVSSHNLNIAFNKFSQYDRNLDVDLNEHTDDNSYTHHNMGIPFGYKSYLNSGYCIIAESETHYGRQEWFNTNKNSWITEKTWLPIVNCMPFIMLAQKNHAKNLQKMGFYTYEDLYKHDLFSDHANPSLMVQELQDSIYNMETCINENFKEIERRALHNRKHFLEMCQAVHDKHFEHILVREHRTGSVCSVNEAFIEQWARPYKIDIKARVVE